MHIEIRGQGNDLQLYCVKDIEGVQYIAKPITPIKLVYEERKEDSPPTADIKANELSLLLRIIREYLTQRSGDDC